MANAADITAGKVNYTPSGPRGEYADPFSPITVEPAGASLPRTINMAPMSAKEYMTRSPLHEVSPTSIRPIGSINPLVMGLQLGMLGAASGLGIATVREAIHRYHGDHKGMGGAAVLKHMLIGGAIGTALGAVLAQQANSQSSVRLQSWDDVTKALQQRTQSVLAPITKGGQAMQKYSQIGVPAYLPASPILGALLGAALAREGERVRGGLYGGLVGGAAGLGAYTGQSAGSLLGGTVASTDSLLRGGNPEMLPGTQMLASGAQGLGFTGGGLAAGIATLQALRQKNDPWRDAEEKDAGDILKALWASRKAIVPGVKALWASRKAIVPGAKALLAKKPWVGKALRIGNAAYGANEVRNNIVASVDAAGNGENEAAGQYARAGLYNAVGTFAPEIGVAARPLANIFTKYRKAKTMIAPTEKAVSDAVNAWRTTGSKVTLPTAPSLARKVIRHPWTPAVASGGGYGGGLVANTRGDYMRGPEGRAQFDAAQDARLHTGISSNDVDDNLKYLYQQQAGKQ